MLGAVFDESLLRAFATESGAFEKALDPLVEADLIQAEGQRGRYRFTHALAHEVVYQNLLLARRTELHERVAARSSAPPGHVRAAEPTSRPSATTGA